MSHYIEKCSICGTVISQCRCMSKEKEIRYAYCDKCQREGAESRPQTYHDFCVNGPREIIKNVNNPSGSFAGDAPDLYELAKSIKIALEEETESPHDGQYKTVDLAWAQHIVDKHLLGEVK